MGDDASGRTVVIGLGNPLMGDDGTGLAALERLQARWTVPDDVLLVDGGTWGMNLLPIIETAGRVLMLDAITFGGTPGELVVLDRHQLPKAFALKFSPHQLDMREVLAAAQLRGTLPDDTAAVGVQPGRVEMGVFLSPEVEAALDRLADMAVEKLESWGHPCHPARAKPVSGSGVCASWLGSETGLAIGRQPSRSPTAATDSRQPRAVPDA